MKAGTKVEPLKVRGSATFDQLDNPKLKRRKNCEQNIQKSTTLTTTRFVRYLRPQLDVSPARPTIVMSLSNSQ